MSCFLIIRFIKNILSKILLKKYNFIINAFFKLELDNFNMIGKSKVGKSFVGLAKYLEHGSKNNSDNIEKVDWFLACNLPEGRSIEDYSKIMYSTANQNYRVKKPVYHLSVSWDKNDVVNRDLMQKTANDLMKSLNLSKNQFLVISHQDTDHKHIHIMANRVNQDSLKAVCMSHDYMKIEKTLREIEIANNLRIVKGTKYCSIKKEFSNNSKEKELRKIIKDGGLSFRELATEISYPIFNKSQTWIELKDELEKIGLYIKKKGRGLVLTDNKDYVKCSNIDRKFSLLNLEKKLGSYDKNFKTKGRSSDTGLYKRQDKRATERDVGDNDRNKSTEFTNFKGDRKKYEKGKLSEYKDKNNSNNNRNFFNDSRYNNRSDYLIKDLSNQEILKNFSDIRYQVSNKTKKIDNFFARVDFHKCLQQELKIWMKDSFKNHDKAFSKYLEVKNSKSLKEARTMLLNNHKKFGGLIGSSFFGIKSAKRKRAIKNLNNVVLVSKNLSKHGKLFVDNPINVHKTKQEIEDLKIKEKLYSRELYFRDKKDISSESVLSLNNDYER